MAATTVVSDNHTETLKAKAAECEAVSLYHRLPLFSRDLLAQPNCETSQETRDTHSPRRGFPMPLDVRCALVQFAVDFPQYSCTADGSDMPTTTIVCTNIADRSKAASNVESPDAHMPQWLSDDHPRFCKQGVCRDDLRMLTQTLDALRNVSLSLCLTLSVSVCVCVCVCVRLGE